MLERWNDGIMKEEEKYNSNLSFFQLPNTQYSNIPIFHYSDCSDQLNHALRLKKNKWSYDLLYCILNFFLILIIFLYQFSSVVMAKSNTEEKQNIKRVNTIHALRISPEQHNKLDPCEYYLFGGNGLHCESAVARMEANWQIEKTIDQDMPDESPHKYIAIDLPFHPIVAPSLPETRKLWPHMCGLYLDVYRQAALTSADERFKKRFLQLADFAVWSQYDRKGRSKLLDFVKIKYVPEPEYYGGWPTHDFRWVDSSGYDTPAYEPSHHMDAMTALALVGAYEMTGNVEYIRAAEAFVRGQAQLFGLHWGEYKGKKTLWTEYNPTTKGRPQFDAVDNVVALFAAPTAAVGYHLKDDELLGRAESFLWWMCKELDEDGRWYYFGHEWFEQGGNRGKKLSAYAISHEKLCIEYSIKTYEYLCSAHRRQKDIEDRLIDSAVFYTHEFGKAVRVRKLIDRNCIKPGEAVTFTVFVVLDNNVDNMLFKDTLPSKWSLPDKIDLVICTPSTREKINVTPAQIKKGVAIPVKCSPGDRIEIFYTITTPRDFSYVADPFSSELKQYSLNRPPEIVVQGYDVISGERYENSSDGETTALRTQSRYAAPDFNNLVKYLYGGQPLKNK